MTNAYTPPSVRFLDSLLSTHTILHFGDRLGDKRLAREFRFYARRLPVLPLPEFLLEEQFTQRRLKGAIREKPAPDLTVQEVYAYVQSLKESVEIWYSLMNPDDSVLSGEEKDWLARLNRLNILEVAPLILVFYQKEKVVRARVRFLKALEKLQFIRTMFRYEYYDVEARGMGLLEIASHLSQGKTQTEKVVKDLEHRVDTWLSDRQLISRIATDLRNSGFYEWRGLRYFLFEYEMYLKSRSKTFRDKLDWDELCGRLEIQGEDAKDYYTIEHVYPQRPRRACWTEKFRQYSDKERSALRHSLGNLVPLSKPKNSSFQNHCFEDKVGKPESVIGFRYGSYSENEIAGSRDWTAKEILLRGLKLVDFLEKRWGIDFGNLDDQIRLLGLEFVSRREGMTVEAHRS